MSRFMIDLWQRCQREGKADRLKGVLLTGLFLLGCCFWIPLLAKVMPKRASAATSQASIAARPLVDQPERQESCSVGSDQFWESLATLLANDPLFQPAEVRGLERDPFLITDAMEPLPVLFAEDPTRKAEVAKPITESPPHKVEVATIPQASRPFHLTSTMISRSQRAAMINGQFVAVGREIETNGQRYELTRVESDRVVLTTGEETIELKIARSRLKDVLDLRPGDDLRE